MDKSVSDMIAELRAQEFPERIPAPPELAEKAQAAVREFQSCFWFRRHDAQVRFLDDIELVIRHLREYGGWKAWGRAQELRKYL